MTTLGIAVIGQAPRSDIASLFGAALPAGARTILRGCLDGLSDAEVDALPPRDGADTLYTRLRGERDVKISKAAVITRAPDVLALLRSDGCEAIVFACTGEFPSILGDAGVVFPSRVLSALAEALLPAGRLGLLVPATEQIEKLAAKWRRPGVEVVAEALLPSAGPQQAVEAARRLLHLSPDLVAMDCMSYTPATKALVKRELGVPIVLAVTATAHVLQELLN
jgi:protein AroM